MMNDNIIVLFKNCRSDKEIDLEIPVDLTANELIYGLNDSFGLGINMDKPLQCYLRADYPKALIRGEKTLEELGIRDGTIIFFDER
ncbi:EsaB/YukD family protein [Butyrivibrio sp. INlla21]|uniref:EsaB/YukD family protein n=1 Tax=Butyrivibrio sp. INlla21 TaxID=1520811 RepID=UPI0008EB41D5|nr:EsaB/YukD family protein [Butyrivibrio sp. INlla21]SFU69450.1 WXG100 protein secretion system (Wss), protein YukD [Butyrivibrio sp. INlla21]